jgi:acyl-CoA hydrolase
MSDPAGPNVLDLGPKFVSAEQALTAIPPGSRIYLGTGCAAPRHLLAALEAMSPGPPDLEFVSFVTTSALPKEAGVPRTRHRHRTFFVGSDVRGLGGSGQLDYVPISLEDVPELLASGKLPIDLEGIFLQSERVRNSKIPKRSIYRPSPHQSHDVVGMIARRFYQHE